MSEALARAKTLYIELEKMAYALLTASRKLRHYFLAHEIIVPTSYPLGNMFRNQEAVGHIGKWAVELAPFAVKYLARSAISRKSYLTLSLNGPHQPKDLQSLPKIYGQFSPMEPGQFSFPRLDSEPRSPPAWSSRNL